MKKMICTLLFLMSVIDLYGQVFGPLSSSTQSSTPTGNAWTNLSNVQSSNNSYASVNATGDTENLVTKGYGFNLLSTDVVTGIKVDVERRSDTGDDVDIMGTWHDGELSKITNFPLSAGNGRMLICFIANENGNEPIISNVTYGGRTMIKKIQFSFNTTFWARFEFWYLPESELINISVGNHDIEVTYAAFVQNEFFDIISAAVFENVDQNDPFYSFQTKQINNGGNTCTFDTPITAANGGLFLTGIFCGNNTSSPSKTNGQSGTYTIDNGFTEGTDVYRSNVSVASTSGGCMQTAYKLAPSGGSVNPTMTFAGTPNRRLMIGIGLRKLTAVDNVVRLLKSGTPIGANYASINQWELSDTQVSYGGTGDLWGTTWTYLDINNPNFGMLLSATIFNGSIHVDQIQITVYTASILPVELISFDALLKDEQTVLTRWSTVSESNSKHFEIERSRDGIHFQTIGFTSAAGFSSTLIHYTFEDLSPLQGIAYYRLKQVDFNGEAHYSDVISATRNESSEFSIYPNPVENWVKVLDSYTQDASYLLYNQLGQQIGNEIIPESDQTTQINLENQSDGIYFLVKKDQSGQTSQMFQKRTTH